MNYAIKTVLRTALCGLAACALPFSLGCTGPKTVAAAAPLPAKSAPAPPTPPPSVLPADDELARADVNEVGVVPILEYHEIDNGSGYMSRSPARFRHDLQRLYEQGFRPITMREYLDNRIDLPLGLSPVILTFDDARASQFRYLSDGTIDPTCALGILQAFHETHPDFPVKATFFVLPEDGFCSPPEQGQRKLQALVKMGCELENHTLKHHYFNHMSDQAIRREIALGQAGIQKAVPNAHIDVLALPGGCQPRSRNHKLLLAGDADGIHYANRAVLLAGAEPAPAPAAKKYVTWRIPRILAVEGGSGVTYWLDDLKQHPKRRYVSDGNLNTLSVPASASARVDKSKLQGAELHIYRVAKVDKSKLQDDAGAKKTAPKSHHRKSHQTA